MIHADPQLERIAARLADNGALALMLIEAEPLGGIERRHGGEVHQKALDRLMGLVREITQEVVGRDEVIVTNERPGNAILAFLFRPRSDLGFYCSSARELSQRLSAELTRKGRRAVYPYLRDPLMLGVGVAVVLHNPNVRPERQILQALEDARRDAQLEVGMQARRDCDRLLRVILSGEISVRYESIVDLRTREPIGYEALSRGPSGSDLHTPRQLFRRAGEAGLMFELDCLCRRVALASSAALPRGSRLFLNCLPTAIGDPNLRDEGLRKTLETHHLEPRDLVLEISESESIENFAIFREMRDSCQEIGIDIAIDDAGTGYSSLEAIMEIAPDYIKTDMGLVRGIDSDSSRQQILRALNAVAEGIGARVIAEGIETEPELETLLELGVPYGQGFLFGPALRPGGDSEGGDSDSGNGRGASG